MNDTEYLIIGGGPCGLGAATRLEEKGKDWHLLEAEDHFGGLAASFKDDQRFTWDLGGHVQFSHYETFDRYMDLALGEDGWFNHERESWIWFRDRFVPYPFQNNLHRLDPEDRDRCLEGLRKAASNAERRVPSAELRELGTWNLEVGTFRDWILATFGDGLADLFMLPYNLKVWAYPAEKLDYHWIEERVAVPDLDAVMKSIETGEDQVSWGPNRTFRFPKFGGTGAVWNSIGRTLTEDRVHMSVRVTKIDAERRVAMTKAGDEWKYRHLISTMPLNHLVELTGLGDKASADELMYSSTNIVGFGIEGQPPEHLKTKCWMYFPQGNSPYYRITVFSNYSCNNVPRPDEQWSLMTETAESADRPVKHARLIDDTMRALQEDGLLSDPDAVCSKVSRRIPMGYPTPFLGRDGVVDTLLRCLEEVDIYSRGRFGAWKYEVSNQDHSFAQGYECVERLVAGRGEEAEPTLFTPQVVNQRRNP